jgi:nucleoid-associated protein YgaU
MKEIYNENFIIDYKEGDRSKERIPIEHNTTIDDLLHIVTQDETLISIAHLYYGFSKVWYVIADVNNIVNPFELEIGQSLIIPNEKLIK